MEGKAVKATQEPF
jgi:hypothetical protein